MESIILNNNFSPIGYRSLFVEGALESAPSSARDWYTTLLSTTEESIRPYAVDVDKKARYPVEAIGALRAIGAFGVTIPNIHKGLDYGDSIAALAVETVATACPSTAAIMMFHYQVVRRVLCYGIDEWRENDLKKLATGEWLGSSAWTEFGAGANKSDLTTRLVRETDGFRINGAKHFCTGLEGASVIHVLLDASNDNEKAPTFVRVKTENKGVDISEIYPLLGLRGSSTGSITLKNVRVNEDCIIGSVGSGGAMMRENHSFFMNPGLIAMGVATIAFSEAHASVLGKTPKSRNITGFQSCRFKLTDMEEKLSQVYALAAAAIIQSYQSELVPPSDFLKIKLSASEAAVSITSEALRLAGSRGFHADWPFERHLRDAYATVLMGPANEVIKERIAEQLLKDPTENNGAAVNPVQLTAKRTS